MKKIIARLMAATERIRNVPKEEAVRSRNQGLGLAADELDLLADELDQKREEYREGLEMLRDDKPKPERSEMMGFITSGPLTIGMITVLCLVMLE